jgi:hypothetical protein
MNTLELKKRATPLDEKDRRLISRGTLIRLCFEGKEPFSAVIETGTTAKVDDSNQNFRGAGIKMNEVVKFKSNNILSIL